jgi:hypothetical protein
MGLHRRAPDQAMIFLEPFHGGVVNRLTSVSPLVSSYFSPRITSRSGFRIRLAWSKQAPNAVIKSFEASLYRGIVIKETNGVVMQERRSRPKANQTSGTIVAPPAPRRVPFEVLLGKRIPGRDLPHRGQALVGLRGEIFPTCGL